MKSFKIGVLFIVFFMAFAYFQVLRKNRVESESEKNTVKLLKDRASDFTLPDSAGNEISLSSYFKSGKLVLVNFWATWCVPCVREMPAFVSLKEKMSDQAFEILAVNVGEDWEKINTFFRDKMKIEPPFPVVLDKSASVVKAWETEKFPETYLVAPDGKILNKFIGEIPWDAESFVKYLEPVLKKYSKTEGKKI